MLLGILAPLFKPSFPESHDEAHWFITPIRSFTSSELYRRSGHFFGAFSYHAILKIRALTRQAKMCASTPLYHQQNRRDESGDFVLKDLKLA
jgi:hypothetical protein